MSIQIESGLKVVVSAVLASVLTLIVITGIGGASRQELARQAALNAPVAALTAHAG